MSYQFLLQIPANNLSWKKIPLKFTQDSSKYEFSGAPYHDVPLWILQNEIKFMAVFFKLKKIEIKYN